MNADGNPYCEPGLDGSTGICKPVGGKKGGKPPKNCGKEGKPTGLPWYALR